MIRNKVVSMLLLCTFVVAASLLMFSSPKAEAATCSYPTSTPVSNGNYQYLYNYYGNYPGLNLIFGQKTYPVQQPKPAPSPSPSPAPTPTPAPTPVPQPAPAPTSGLTAEEQQMVNLVNQERVKTGLQPLTVDSRLVTVARMKSKDMIDNNYFGHQSPTYGSPFDMMKSQGISFSYAGENIAGNQSVEAAHTSLMNSPGHRANILNPEFKNIGIGIVHGGPYGMMISQEFTG
ncbi:MAG: Cysteine-rich secretory protein family protein [Pelotomaculum sp. PtaU1.Bin035]|nr:MAG: Cysteine-rich secretory protein family protein [Pelotomaculum sp. PtaU1.Bin035]